MVVPVQTLSLSFPSKPPVQMERLRPAALAGSFNTSGLKLLFYVGECIRFLVCNWWPKCPFESLLQPLIRLHSSLATWITQATPTWWPLLWMSMSWPTFFNSSISEWFHCWISPGRKCWLLSTSSFNFLIKEFMVSESSVSFYIDAWFQRSQVFIFHLKF